MAALSISPFIANWLAVNVKVESVFRFCVSFSFWVISSLLEKHDTNNVTEIMIRNFLFIFDVWLIFLFLKLIVGRKQSNMGGLA